MKTRKLMNCFLLFGGIFCSLVSCDEAEIDPYQYTAALNFRDYVEGSDFDLITSYHSNFAFKDIDYCRHIQEKRDSVCVILVGSVLPEDRTFCLKVENIPDSEVAAMQIKLDNNGVYTLKAGNMEAWAFYTVAAPKDYGVKHSAYLVIDTENPAHQFVRGRLEAMKLKPSITYDLQNLKWNSTYLGAFSTGKYKFIMDIVGKTLDEYPLSYADKKFFADQYQAWLDQANLPILDDEGLPIVWPK